MSAESGENGVDASALKEFEFTIFDLYTGAETELRDCLYEMAENLNMPRMKGPLFSMAHELAVNALKATYKRVYYKFFLEEVGLDDVPYEDWLKLFKTEIEAHQAENFARVCRDKNLFVKVEGKHHGDMFRIEVMNEGMPSDVEFERLKRIIQNARERNAPAFIFDDDGDEQKEGGGLGITLIIMSLRNMGISPDNFQVVAEDEKTFARLDLPLEVLLKETGDAAQA